MNKICSVTRRQKLIQVYTATVEPSGVTMCTDSKDVLQDTTHVEKEVTTVREVYEVDELNGIGKFKWGRS